jgi:glutamyl-tRNA reductase
MMLACVGLSHVTAPLEVRERATFAGPQLQDALLGLGRAPGVREAALLCTCNRTEIWAAVENAAGIQAIADWLERSTSLAEGELRPYLYLLSDEQAVRHAFRVASGLDSMVLGESHVIKQVKDAAHAAQAARTLGPLLHKLFQCALAASKEVRCRTAIGADSGALIAEAVRLACEVFGDLRDTRVLLLGAGKIIGRAAGLFAAQRPGALVVANRTASRARELAEHHSAATLGFAEVAEHLASFDIVLACTASPRPIVGVDAVRKASLARGRRPLFLADLSLPRGIEPGAAGLPGVLLYSIDDLGRRSQSQAAGNATAVTQAEAILGAHTGSFMNWLRQRESVPLLRRLNQRAERLRAAELARARRRLAVGEPVEGVLAGLAHALSNKLLHAPRVLIARGALAPESAQKLIGD